MAEFILDTSGSIHFATPYAKAHGLKTFYRWPDLPPFEQGCGEAMAHDLFISLRRQGWGHLAASEAVAFRNWAPETLAAIKKDYADYAGPFFKSDGSTVWAMRQKKLLTQLPPRTIDLDDEGKVRLREIGK